MEVIFIFWAWIVLEHFMIIPNNGRHRHHKQILTLCPPVSHGENGAHFLRVVSIMTFNQMRWSLYNVMKKTLYIPDTYLKRLLFVVQLGLQGVHKKMSHSFCLISLATKMLEGHDIIHWKVGIHSFVKNTKTFLYNIWEPRYKQIKMGYQILKCLNIGQS